MPIMLRKKILLFILTGIVFTMYFIRLHFLDHYRASSTIIYTIIFVIYIALSFIQITRNNAKTIIILKYILLSIHFFEGVVMSILKFGFESLLYSFTLYASIPLVVCYILLVIELVAYREQS